MKMPSFLLNKQEHESFAEPNVVTLKSTKNRDYRQINTLIEQELKSLMDDFSKTVHHSPQKNLREIAYKRDMYQNQDSNDDVKVIYAGKNGAFSNKILKAKPTTI